MAVAGNTCRTDDGVEALGLVVPVDAQEVDGHAGQHDGQADAAHHGLRVQREDEQEGPEQQVDDGPDQADLEGGGGGGGFMRWDKVRSNFSNPRGHSCARGCVAIE